MSEDIGPGDEVEAIRDLPTEGIVCGTRATVLAVDGVFRCGTCGHDCTGVRLVEYRLPYDGGFLLCSWKKIGGSQADTVRRFAEDLTPAKVKEPA